MVVGHGNEIRLFIRRLDFIIYGLGHGSENLVLQRLPRDQGHIIGTGYMPFIRQPMRIDEVAVLASQLLCPLIHHIRKIFDGAAHMYRQGVGRIVGRCQHHAVKAVLHRKLLTFVKRDMGPLVIHVHRFVGNGNHFVQPAVLHCEKGRHDFGYTGGIILGMHIFAVQDGSRGNLHDNARFRNNRRPRRPEYITAGLAAVTGIFLLRFPFTGFCFLSGRRFFAAFRIMHHFIFNCTDGISRRKYVHRGRKKNKRRKNYRCNWFPFIFHQGVCSLQISNIPNPQAFGSSGIIKLSPKRLPPREYQVKQIITHFRPKVTFLAGNLWKLRVFTNS